MSTLFRRIKLLFIRDRYLADLEAEMLLHRELRADWLAGQGLSADEAAAAATRRFGNSTLLKEGLPQRK